jgi:hypothetical protein
MSEGKARSLMEEKMTPEQQQAAMKAFAKQQAVDRAAYKKQLREGNELKRLQVEELQFNNMYYEQKKLWLENQPKLEELEAQEQAIRQKERAEREKLIKEQQEAAEKSVAAAEKPDIVIPKQGKSREE